MEALSSSHVFILPLDIGHHRVAFLVLRIAEQISLSGCTFAILVKGNKSNELTEVLHRESGENGTLQDCVILQSQFDGWVRNPGNRTFAGAGAVGALF